jgi:lysyl-tRNA synthetase class II
MKYQAIITYGNWKRQIFENKREFDTEAAAKLWIINEVDSGDYVCPQGEVFSTATRERVFLYTGAEQEEREVA